VEVHSTACTGAALNEKVWKQILRVLVEKLVAHLVGNFSAFYIIGNFITVLTKA
jgi:hypothetical protein